MNRPVIVGVDNSTSAVAAVNVAAEEAVASGVALRIVHVDVWPILYAVLANLPYQPRDWLPAKQSADRVTAVANRVRGLYPDLEIQRVVTTGGAGSVLVEESRNATAVVVGGRGAGGVAGLLTGSVTSHVVTHAHCPVLVVHEGQTTGGPGGRVVVGVDGPEHSLSAVRYACRWARNHAADVVAIYAVPGDQFDPPMPEYGLRTPANLRLEDWVGPVLEEFAIADGEYVTVHATSPEEALVHASESARLVVVGESGRHSSLIGGLLGSVRTALLSRSSCPVSIVHDGPTDVAQDRGAAPSIAEMGTTDPAVTGTTPLPPTTRRG